MGFASELSRRLSRAVTLEQSEHRVPSISAAYVRDGEVVWADAVGHVDGRSTGALVTPDTQYRIGSITKPFVAVLVLRLVDAGLLGLDDRVGDHLPSTPIAATTVAELLSQRSGLRAETEGPWWERTSGGDWTSLSDQLALRPVARGVFHYSNVGFAVLAEIVARLRGRPWLEVLAAEILTPLGLSRTSARPQSPYAPGFAVHPHAALLLPEPEHDAGAMAPAGQLWSTTADLARFAGFLHRGHDDVLGAEAVQLMRVPRAVVDVPGQPWTAAYGYGLQTFNTDGRRQIGHGGSMPGFQASLRIDVDSGDAAIVMANSTAGWGTDLTGHLFELVAELDPIVATPWLADPDQAPFVELTGTWFWGPAAHTLHLRADGGLDLRPHGKGRGSRFRLTGPDQWVGLDGYYLGEPLEAVRVDGALSHLDLASYRLSRRPYDPATDVPGGVDGSWS